jgi:hypothetical protein
VGNWSGTLTIERTGEPVSSGEVTWRIDYLDRAKEPLLINWQSKNPWLSIGTITSGTIDSPTQPPANFTADGSYRSPRGGCVGTISFTGVADARTINADVSGIDCPTLADPNFSGHVELSKD